MHSETHRQQPSDVLLWFSLLIGVVAWSSQLVIDYILVGLRCATGANAFSWAVTAFSVAMAALTALGLITGYRVWKRTELGLNVEDRSSPSIGRAAMMGLAGTISNVIFLVLIVVSMVPNTFMEPCVRIG